ncbi:WD40 repeat-like protein, partial [Peniophora sp. CONT]
LSMVLSPDKAHILTGDEHGDVCIWNAQDGRLTQIVTEESLDCSVFSVAFSPKGNLIASGSTDHRVRIWPILHGIAEETPLTLEGHVSEVECVAFSPDGTLLVSGARDGTICIWNSYNGSLALPPFHHPRFSKGEADWLMSVAFSPDGRRVVSGSRNLTICVWD